MTETTLTCPSCYGAKVLTAHVNTGPDSSRHRWEQRPCYTCKGHGTITSAQADAMARGAELRDARIRRGESLYDAARRMGIGTAALSALERGRVADA